MCLVCKRIAGEIADQDWNNSCYIYCCPKVPALPELPPIIYHMDLAYSRITELPPVMEYLETLDISRCKNLTKLPLMPCLRELRCIGSNLTKINCGPGMQELVCSDSPFLTEIDCGCSSATVICKNCPMLTDLYNSANLSIVEIGHKTPWLKGFPCIKQNIVKLTTLQRWYRRRVYRRKITAKNCLQKKLYTCLVEKILGYTFFPYNKNV